ncbi:MAG: Glycosyl transferases group 1 [candidate division WS2 bacterium ADurb.Bin280]|uniref:Glycosyl transferases group 1 n=1 Tax=candidate division WS2 bacterium ADurb.Bin280 TaxID=1852829 RepID=A0A1V5SDU7_9BACT|nr:MAG: Glycosyl transferases group 1 [candidate division WS2 bacterium ADurb.Bin280]
MLYISDFYAKREAVSNQIEILRSKTNSYLFSAARFLKQEPLSADDIKNKKFILTETGYTLLLPIIARVTRNGIHYFEEEPSGKMREIFNKSNSNLYISMYRRPNQDYVQHLRGYKNLKKVFVELPEHREIMIKNGIRANMVKVFRTPSLFSVKKSRKVFNPDNIQILFASWNNAEGNPLEDRGINFLLKMLRKDTRLNLTVMPRDDMLEAFNKQVDKLGVKSRVKMKWPANKSQLKSIFDESDFIAFPPKRKISKDVPNSIIDGLSLGKPAIISNVIDFSAVVREKRMGIVINDFDTFRLEVGKEEYSNMSNNSVKYSELHSVSNYSKIIEEYL